ncbi:uncharacterized protein LAESUDRAFT_760731 [Laetiporus sulphureus 93-53]|uniref:Uncharacterized protein n=1 Tax=Laetiporus sulphureus 93-53 TaxID=1314785 RepID=A0A165DJA9_9APHY|nr:uncharacterized protein LAESUDRAFT_760731 [Laetiporus sulphureus 93-53]KZT05006.1 hypothetical protein LAESUDRAFT_760731 [Laetiporus sulphureus 93-53]
MATRRSHALNPWSNSAGLPMCEAPEITDGEPDVMIEVAESHSETRDSPEKGKAESFQELITSAHLLSNTLQGT